MKDLTHIDKNGLPGMVDVSAKKVTHRVAEASGELLIEKELMDKLVEQGFETSKGSILQTAIIAGTMAVKKTYGTIPFCHQIPIGSCKIKIETKEDRFLIVCKVKTNSNTGVEMEALHGVSVAALAIYDMCKAWSQNMTITNIRLEQKQGGKNDFERKTS